MNVVLVLAGGVGSRMGLNVPKQYYEVAGRHPKYTGWINTWQQMNR